MQSTQRQLAAYLRLINECGWDALACHPPLLHLWMPWRAEALARAVMSELEKELAGQPRPVVFLSFSGGYKACQWKIMEALLSAPFHQRQPYDGDTAAASALTSPGLASGLAHVNSTSRSHKVSPSSSHHRFLGLLRECFAGQIFDSSPVDFTSDLGVRFLSQQPATPQPTSTSQHPASPQQPATSQQPATPLPTSTSQQPATKASAPSTLSDTPVAAPAPTAAPAAPAAPAAISPPSTLRRTLVRSAATALDWLLLPEFERQRAAQWQSLLHSSVLAPVLLLCSTDDQLAPIAFIRKYAGEAEARGATVKAVEWSTSEHVGHLRHHRREYTAALHAFLERALLLWKQRQASSRGGGAGSDGGAAVAPRSRL
ncbi:hypothetical protein CLOM_g2176 [Closterium sp. NIES-68]|nr:hypothetical protein CLOM_g2176 [Closterium sp. NIES-68]GJP68794.1 hypothetical protein CLOP_g25452 [Closterium sp. NIES-67]